MHPDDESPCVDGEPSADAVAADTRSAGQRNHDALKAMGRSLLASGELGSHNGLPATIIVSTTLQDLQSGGGVAVTAGGTLLPMREVIRQASQAHHYLVIYDKHTRQPLYCGRARRLATPGQRIVLHALERGCTRPGCTAPGYWSQVHHVDGWAKGGGETNIDKLTLACGPDNRAVEEQGWTTRKLTYGGLGAPFAQVSGGQRGAGPSSPRRHPGAQASWAGRACFPVARIRSSCRREDEDLIPYVGQD